MKFKVGDKAKVIKKGTHRQEMGAIVKILRVDERNERYYAECPYEGNWYIKEDELATISFTKSDLKDGDKCTLKDGRVVYYNKDRKYSSSYCFENLDKNLRIDFNDNVSIVKVERPTQYEIVFERKEEILDEAEKRYLRDFIRPFRNTVRFIEKEDNGKIARIKICFDYHFMFFPPLEKEKKMYEGMQPNRVYSLEELGL